MLRKIHTGPSTKRNLQATRRSGTYRKALLISWNLLAAFCIHHSLAGPRDVGANPDMANRILIAFCQDLYQNEQAIHLATNSILALQYVHRNLRGQLRAAWDSVETWSQEVDNQNRPPMPPVVLGAFCGLARLKGLQAGLRGDKALGYMYITMALWAKAAFYGLLRPYEMFALCPALICIPSTTSNLMWTIAAIEQPKAWRALGRKQFATLRHPGISEWLRWLLPLLSKRDRFWPSTHIRFRQMMADLLKELNLSEYHFTPGSFRAGGATLWASMGIDIARLRFWGRWAAEASVAHYVQEASAYMIINQLSFSHLSKLELFVSAVQYTKRPPSFPWYTTLSRP
jgi:hypothetical protein